MKRLAGVLAHATVGLGMVAACGSTPARAATPASAATTADVRSLCEDVGRELRRVVDGEARKTIGCALTAAMAAQASEDHVAGCQRAFDDCHRRAMPLPDDADVAQCERKIGTLPRTCDATLGELRACLIDSAHALRANLDAFDCASLTSGTWAMNAPTPRSCEVVAARCGERSPP